MTASFHPLVGECPACHLPLEVLPRGEGRPAVLVVDGTGDTILHTVERLLCPNCATVYVRTAGLSKARVQSWDLGD